MARRIGKLPPVALQKPMKPGMHADGGGLYLQVTASGAKSWIFRFMLNGRAREMGLGPLHTVSLAEARERATECRKLRLDGIDPVEDRKAKRAAPGVTTATTAPACHKRARCVRRRTWSRPASGPNASRRKCAGTCRTRVWRDSPEMRFGGEGH